MATDPPEPTALGNGSSLIIDGVGWVYTPDPKRGFLGTVVVWAERNELDTLNLIVDNNSASLAAVAAGFADSPMIWEAEGTELRPAEPVPAAMPAAPETDEFVSVLVDAGLEVVADHGVWIGELNGLEVARIGLIDGTPTIDLGVGAYDQFAAAAIDPDRDPAEALRMIIGLVAPHRQPGSEPHPMGRLVRSRWLRAQAVRNPALVGLEALHPVPLLEARPGLQEDQPAAALGAVRDDEVLVVFAVGLDLGVSETAAGLIGLHEPTRVIVAMPSRDHHDRIRSSLDRLSVPVDLIALEGEWAG